MPQLLRHLFNAAVGWLVFMGIFKELFCLLSLLFVLSSKIKAGKNRYFLKNKSVYSHIKSVRFFPHKYTKFAAQSHKKSPLTAGLK
jgi:hypothetical protein